MIPTKHTIRSLIPLATAVLVLFAGLTTSARAAPGVAVTLKPIHSLVAGVMGETGAPDLLLTANTSPHDAALKPSQLKALHAASVVFLVDEHLEQFATRALAGVGADVTIVALMDDPALKLLPGRHAGIFSQDETPEPSTSSHDHAHHTKFDPHVWLSPSNAIAITEIAIRTLGTVDPENAHVYRANGDDQIKRIRAHAISIQSTLESVSATPYFVYHDAWIYFETAFSLNALGAVAPRTGARPGAKRVRALRERIASSGARCIFEEPQFSAKLIATLAEGTDVKVSSIDPVGAALTPGPQAWFTLMTDAADSITTCLSP